MSRAPQALTAPLAARVEEAFRLVGAGRVADALSIARKLAGQAPQAPDAHHVLAVCLAAADDAGAARQAFRRALELAPDHPLVLGNYARFLQQAGQPEEAMQALERAARAAPGTARTWTELGLCALKLGRTAQAAAALERAVSLEPGSARAWHALGNVRRAGDDLEQAEPAFRRAVELAPRNGLAWVSLALTLRLLGRPAEAVPCLEQACTAGLSGPELIEAQTGVLADIGQFGAALEKARLLARSFPRHAAGQVMLVHLLWEHGAALAPGEDPFGMIEAAVQGQPDNFDLQLAYIGLLLETRQAESALRGLQSLRRLRDQPLLVALQANAHEILDQPGLAGELYAQAHRALGNSDPSFLNAYTRHLLRAGKWDEAALRATEATQTDPHNQEAWAYLGTAWRLIGDPREYWLCDYENLIGLAEVEPPPGFDGMPGFLAGLAAALEPLHKARREPIHQSLRGGSQTPGKLFGRLDPVIAAAQAALLQAIEHRLRVLPADPNHPFLRRKSRSVRFSGSWSVKLWSSGSHVNHIHSEGWMSSAFYVSLPPSVSAKADAGDTAGFIQFGQPPLELGLDLAPRRVICPRTGYLALFPSYMWHGTVPFADEAPRITVAFDMKPLN